MDEQALYRFYVLVVVGIFAQSTLAWEWGSKGIDRIRQERLGVRIWLPFALFAGGALWQRTRDLPNPFTNWTDCWPLGIAVLVFLIGRTRRPEAGTRTTATQRRYAVTEPRLAAFLRAKDLYYAYVKRVNLPLEKWPPRHQKEAAADASLGEAKVLFQKALDLSLEDDWPRDAGIAGYHLGMLFHVRGDNDAARETFQVALSRLDDFSSDNEAVGSSAGCHYHLGQMDEAEGNHSSARVHFRRAYDLEMSIGETLDAHTSKTALERCGGSIAD
jgi:tetratricopeptide (TPR) repeat protein